MRSSNSPAIIIFVTFVVLLIAEDPQCTRWQKNLSTNCISKTTGFFKKFHEHHFENPFLMSHFNDTVEDIIKCFHDLPCKSNLDNKLSNRIGAYRDTMFALTDAFVKCSNILEAHNSDCFYSWDPFLGIDTDGRILDNFDTRDVCKNYFGTRECIKHEIVEYCTIAAWRNFKKHAKEFGERIYGCDFRGAFLFPIRYNH